MIMLVLRQYSKQFTRKSMKQLKMSRFNKSGNKLSPSLPKSHSALTSWPNQETNVLLIGCFLIISRIRHGFSGSYMFDVIIPHHESEECNLLHTFLLSSPRRKAVRVGVRTRAQISDFNPLHCSHEMFASDGNFCSQNQINSSPEKLTNVNTNCNWTKCEQKSVTEGTFAIMTTRNRTKIDDKIDEQLETWEQDA